MSLLGRISQIWRYPIKSMGGEHLNRAHIGLRGILGDRGWAVRDETAGEIRGAKKIPELLRCTARYLAEPSETMVPPAEITLRDGALLRSDDPDVAARLSHRLGRSVSLWPLQPAAALDHYRRRWPDDPDLLKELRDLFGRLDDEPLPDLSAFPPELMEYTSPPGTYFDAFPLHLLTTASLTALASYNPTAGFDVRRFRPNLLIETPSHARGLVEQDWCGKVLRVGRAQIKVELPCARCVMTTLPQGDLPHDPSVLRTVVRHAAQNAGIYASVVSSGSVALGDDIELI